MIKKSISAAMSATLTMLLLALPLALATAQTVITGTLIDERSNTAIPGATVSVLAESTVTDVFGVFKLSVSVPDGDILLLTISHDGHVTQEREVKSVNGQVDLGDITMATGGGPGVSVLDELIPTITLSSDDQISGSIGGQNISGVLTASQDVFAQAAAFNFGTARFNVRGYSARYTQSFINGMPMDDLEDGDIFFNLWAGLNDVTRNRTIHLGLEPSTFAYGGVGGSSNIDTRASAQRRQLRVGYATTNRTYRHRLMATYSTGMLKSGWAFSMSASRRWAQEGYIAGTPQDAYSYFLSVDRKLGRDGILNLTAFGAPTKRGRTSGAIQEVYDLSGSNFYNANWGYQNGEKRNARLQHTHQPIVILRGDWDINDRIKLMASAGQQFGRNGVTALDWYNASDPRPDYYRYLPSYFPDSPQAEQITALWESGDESVRQIDWDRLYQTNYNSFGTVENANGIPGNTVSGKRSQYILEERRTDVNRTAFNAVIENFVSDRVTLRGGMNYTYQKSKNFKTLFDLLGGDFFVNVNRFAEFDSIGAFTQNNIEVPNQIIRQGDRFGYDYDLNTVQSKLWAQANVSLPRVDFFAALQGGQSSFWRVGNIANGQFPTSSKGSSETKTFNEWAAKGGVTYKINGRNYLLLNGGYEIQAPFAVDAFASPRTRNQIVDDLETEKITTVEGGYLMRAPGLKLRAIGYFTRFEDRTTTRSFFLDNAIQDENGVSGGFVNYVTQGVNTQHAGVELAAQVKISPSLEFSAVAAIGQYIYTARPDVTVYLDLLATEINRSTIYIDNYNVGGQPHEAYTATLRYSSPKYWFANVSFNYFTGTYLDFYPLRRTVEAVSYVANPDYVTQVVTPDSPLWNKILDQDRTPAAYTVDLFCGKSFKLPNTNTFIYFNLGVNNVLNNTDFRTGGFEQFRFDFETKDVDRFPNRYFYSFGRNYFASVTFRI